MSVSFSVFLLRAFLNLYLSLSSQIPELANPYVCMKDPQRVEEILTAMQKAGSNTLQVYFLVLECVVILMFDYFDFTFVVNMLFC